MTPTYLGAKDDNLDNIEVDEESFREDLERDSVHSSMSERPPPGRYGNMGCGVFKRGGVQN